MTNAKLPSKPAQVPQETALPPAQGEVSQKPALCEVCGLVFGILAWSNKVNKWACMACRGCWGAQ